MLAGCGIHDWVYVIHFGVSVILGLLFFISEALSLSTRFKVNGVVQALLSWLRRTGE